MEKKSRQEILAEVLGNAAALMLAGNNNIEVDAKDENGEVFYSTTLQKMAQWDYSKKDWANMDFWLLAGETMEALGIKES